MCYPLPEASPGAEQNFPDLKQEGQAGTKVGILFLAFRLTTLEYYYSLPFS